jgi:uncharacterized Rmd1/YagE family protein
MNISGYTEDEGPKQLLSNLKHPHGLPHRTTKTTEKLVWLVNGSSNPKQDLSVKTLEVDAHRELLACRVTAYCTASEYQTEKMNNYWIKKGAVRVERFDECSYCLYTQPSMRRARSSNFLLDNVIHQRIETLNSRATREMFIMNYGVIVLWGFTRIEEEAILSQIVPFEIEKLKGDEVEIEEFLCSYDPEHKEKIYNDM